jgi:hypothetical protein
VRCRLGIIIPRLGLGSSGWSGMPNSPVGLANWGKELRSAGCRNVHMPGGRGQDERAVGQLTLGPSAFADIERLEQVVAATTRRTLQLPFAQAHADKRQSMSTLRSATVKREPV